MPADIFILRLDVSKAHCISCITYTHSKAWTPLPVHLSTFISPIFFLKLLFIQLMFNTDFLQKLPLAGAALAHVFD